MDLGVEDLDQEKLTPLLRLKYHNSIAGAVADLGRPEEIGPTRLRDHPVSGSELSLSIGEPAEYRDPTRWASWSDMKQQARTFAVEAHGEQKYGDHPYSFHIDAVAAIVEPYGEEAVVVAYLHDTAEDTGVTIAEIGSKFGSRIAACVALLTDEPGATRKERKAKTYAKLADVHGSNELALVIKAADRLANVRACIMDHKESLWKLYQSEQATFKSSAYRSGLCDPLWSELEALLAENAFDTEA